MELEGRIIAVLEARSGVAARTGNTWKVQSYVLETNEQYPKRMCFEVFGEDRINQFNIQEGQELRVSFDVDAHEYQGRWYNQLRAWRVDPAGAPQPAATPVVPQPAAPAFAPAQPAVVAPFDDPAAAPASTGDDSSALPF